MLLVAHASKWNTIRRFTVVENWTFVYGLSCLVTEQNYASKGWAFAFESFLLGAFNVLEEMLCFDVPGVGVFYFSWRLMFTVRLFMILLYCVTESLSSAKGSRWIFCFSFVKLPRLPNQWLDYPNQCNVRNIPQWFSWGRLCNFNAHVYLSVYPKRICVHLHAMIL